MRPARAGLEGQTALELHGEPRRDGARWAQGEREEPGVAALVLAAIPVVEEPWAPGETVRDATRDLVNALQAMTDSMIAFVITTLPILMLILIGPAILGYLVYRRWWKGRGATSAPATS
jgi:hypothetical protein